MKKKYNSFSKSQKNKFILKYKRKNVFSMNFGNLYQMLFNIKAYQHCHNVKINLPFLNIL